MTIAHASEYLTLSDPSFVHAVGLALGRGAPVCGIHVQRGVSSETSPPSPRELLTRWGHATTTLEHRWLTTGNGDDVADAVLDLLAEVKPELLVVGTRARGGLSRLFAGSVAEAVARNAGMLVLVLPLEGPGLVSAETGAVSLTRALVLAGRSDDTQAAVDALVRLTKLAGVTPGSVELFHVDDGTPAPQPLLPVAFDVTHHRARGPLERAAAQRVTAYEPNLVVMTSHGHDQLSDIVFASHTERVLHEVRRPLLWVPAVRAT